MQTTDAVRAALELLNSVAASDQAEGASIAADIFHALNGNEWLSGPRYHFDAQNPEHSNVQVLERTLLQRVRSDPATDAASSMVWALGKRYNPELRSFFIEVIEKTLAERAPALYQAIIALDNLDEPCLRNVGTFSAQDHDHNRRLAQRVLAAAAQDSSHDLHE